MTSTPDIIKDRRAQGRIRVSFPVELRDISFAFKGSAVDLSPGGIRVMFAAAPPLVNTDLELTLRVGPLGAALREHPSYKDVLTEPVRTVLARYVTPRGVRMPSSVWVVTARRGGG